MSVRRGEAVAAMFVATLQVPTNVSVLLVLS